MFGFTLYSCVLVLNSLVLHRFLFILHTLRFYIVFVGITVGWLVLECVSLMFKHTPNIYIVF